MNVFEFFKSTLFINLSVCLVCLLFGNIDSLFFIFASFGFMISIFYKEIYRKSDYLFYANNGISKMKLIISSYFCTLSLSILGMILFFYIKKLF
ncbi:hypothetical protein CLU82_2080 [Flavobacterium sp. 5]|nr:hypothetical protein CLU82_2080 [Flavobacterium sp. 5]